MPEIAGKVADGFAAAVREHEEQWLSPLAVRSYETRGREAPEEECRLRTPFQRDRDRIVHSKAFRRLRHKTQVFVDPEGDHFRTRLTHTLEAAGIARGVARGLRLNEDLTEAIAVGHDVGHPPFGHAGEEALSDALEEVTGRRFRHNEHSLRIVEHLERGGRGLNLTHEVRDGILNHTGDVAPATLEGRIVKLVDRVAYINHDIDDAIRAGVLHPDRLPGAEVDLLGQTAARRIDRFVHDLVENSSQIGDILLTPRLSEALLTLRAFMFEEVYLRPDGDDERRRVRHVVASLFGHFLAAQPDREPASIARVVDHVAGMTDRYALRTYRELFEPEGWALS
jgi:dGTPase